MVVERAEQLERERLVVVPLDPGELLLEAPVALVGRRRHEVGHRPAVDECELSDPASEPWRQRSHPADELVLERMVFRLDENVEAENGLHERRVGEAQALDGKGRNVKADRHRFSFWRKS
jgi:hypothetical protein